MSKVRDQIFSHLNQCSPVKAMKLYRLAIVTLLHFLNPMATEVCVDTQVKPLAYSLSSMRKLFMHSMFQSDSSVLEDFSHNARVMCAYGEINV